MKAGIVLDLILWSALYGFAVGSVHSLTFAARNLVKFPLLLLVTVAVCALSYYFLARFITRRLSFRETLELSTRIFRDTALLLGSLAPVCWFLARVIDQPDAGGLNEYPFFLGLNVALIAICGAAALVRRSLDLLRRYRLRSAQVLAVIAMWLVVSLLTGSQAAWYLRPFYGVSTIGADRTPFLLGRQPDINGATSFYEAVANIVSPPPLKRDYRDIRWE
jgi:hypothetical protein